MESRPTVIEIIDRVLRTQQPAVGKAMLMKVTGRDLRLIVSEQASITAIWPAGFTTFAAFRIPKRESPRAEGLLV